MPRYATPTMFQTEVTECGAVSLGIVLAYYGRWEPIEALRIRCGVSRDATDMEAIQAAARSFHMLAPGYGPTIQQLRTATSPLIIHWEGKHFVVLEGFATDGVYINDPARGPTKVSHVEFAQSYTRSKASMLRLIPDKGFTRTPKPPGVWQNLLKRLRLVEPGISNSGDRP